MANRVWPAGAAAREWRSPRKRRARATLRAGAYARAPSRASTRNGRIADFATSDCDGPTRATFVANGCAARLMIFSAPCSVARKAFDNKE